MMLETNPSKWLLIYSFCLVFSCNSRNNRIIYDDENGGTGEIEEDSTRIPSVKLPVLFDSTDVILHPVIMVETERRMKGIDFGSGSYSSYEYGGVYDEFDQITGDITNIIFELKDSVSYTLTDENLLISSLRYLRRIYRATGNQYLLYNVRDSDSNGNKEFDYQDLESLYISRLNGTEFKKLTPDMHDFHDSKLIPELNRFYYITQEDINKDGTLDKTDLFHYYFIQFTKEGYTVEEYNPYENLE